MNLEARIAAEVARHPLDRWLLALRAIPPYDNRTGRGIPPHVIGTAARFVTRYGAPGPMTASAIPLPRHELTPLLHLAGDFAHADPAGWNPSAPKSLLSIMLRHVGNQFPYSVRPTGSWGRAQIMFNELPEAIRQRKNASPFDFHRRFTELTGVSITDFIDIGYVIYSAAKSANHLGFARDYFEKARRDGMTIGDDATVRQVMRHFAADSAEHAELSVKYQQQDRNFAAYDFNSLFVFPLIRPWPLNDERMEFDRMIAPLPELVLYRLTSGVYYHMRDRWKQEFDEFFGPVLEAYVGRLLKSFVAPANLISEDELRTTFPTSAGKTPDWIVVDGRSAILIEVKVARVHRKVYATGAEDKLDENLNAIRSGLRQLFEFRQSVSRKASGLDRLSRCKEFINVLITLEPTYLSGSAPFKDRLRDSLVPEMRSMEWAMLSLEELEWCEVHLSGGEIDTASAFRAALHLNSAKLIDSMAKQSRRTFGHSMLHRKEQELCQRIGVPAT